MFENNFSRIFLTFKGNFEEMVNLQKILGNVIL